MNEQLTALAARLEGLERQNRRYRRAGAALLALVLTLGATAALAPAVCETVSAQRFILTDASGRERMRWNAYGGESASMQLFDSNGRELAALSWNDGVRIEFKDRDGVPASALRVDGNGRAYFEERLGRAGVSAEQLDSGNRGCGNVHGVPNYTKGCWNTPPPGEITGPR